MSEFSSTNDKILSEKKKEVLNRKNSESVLKVIFMSFNVSLHSDRNDCTHVSITKDKYPEGNCVMALVVSMMIAGQIFL